MAKIFILSILSAALICGAGLRSATAEDLATVVRKMDELLRAQNFAAAEPYVRTYLAMVTKDQGRETEATANAAHTLATTLMNEGKNTNAEPFARQALTTLQKVKGASSGAAGNAANTLALILMNLARDAEAEPFVRLHVVSLEKEAGPNSGAVGNALNTQIRLFRGQGRSAEALPIALRVKQIWEKEQGKDGLASANISNTIAILLNDLGRPAEAEPYVRHTLEIWQKLEPRGVPNGRNTLADTLDRLGKKDEALEQSRLAIEGWAKFDGSNSGSVALGSNNLAFKYLGARKLDQAQAQFQRAYDIWSKMDGQSPGRGTAIVLGGLADVAYLRQDWERSYDLRSKAVTIWIDRTVRTAAGVRLAGTEKATSEIAQSSGHLSKLVKTAHRITPAAPAKTSELTAATFVQAQWRLSSGAADALSDMATRNATEDIKLTELVRERQDRVAEWQKADRDVAGARGVAADRREQRAIDAVEKRRAEIDVRIAAIDVVLKSKFSKYADLAITQPLAVEQVQAELKPDEALVLTLDTGADNPLPQETFIWVVTKTGEPRWVRSEMGTVALSREVAALRCGLDYAGSWRAEKSRCKELTGKDYTPEDRKAGEPLPFDSARAYDLYKALFGEVEDLINDKHLLIVPSGPLTQLPFHVLVTEKPAEGASTADPRIAWLARSNAITVLPAVSSLKALRQNAKASAAMEPFIGFGDPVLDGNPKCGTITVPDKCPDEEMQLATAEAQMTRSAAALDDVPGFFRGGLANVAAVRKLCPLPDTAKELACVAKSLGAPANSILIGRNMTETALKKAPLNRYQVIHFATHGLLAGQTAKMAAAHAEPALVMSPPDTPTEEDDGLLMASEIAALKLDADWVVMSACNTAGGAEPGGEALSGLARAFFFAGARALLVSHWPVSSYAATMLTSRTFAEMRNAKSIGRPIGRSEALRLAMLALMSDPDRTWAAHPSVWAPFVVVGEGAAGR